MALSLRGTAAAQPNDAFQFWSILSNLWHPETNPDGFVMLGLAENTLMHDTLVEHIHSNIALPKHNLTYGDGSTGSKRLKSALSRFLTKHLRPVRNIESEHIVITNGCSSALEHMSWAFSNPGEAFLIGQPFYGTFVPDFTLRTGAHLLPVPFHDADPVGSDIVQYYEAVLQEAASRDQRVAGLILCNPHNPLGRCYSRETIIGLMRFCQKHQIHMISDEIYALSVWTNDIDTSPPPVPFHSILSIDPQDIIDPALVHVVWGMSKDFGANGIRLGAMISQHNPSLIAAMVPVALYSSASSVSDHLTCNILEDEHWVESYIDENCRRLAKHYRIAVEWAKAHGIDYAPGVNAAFFLWVNLGKAWKNNGGSYAAGEVDQTVAKALLDKKVFLASGKNFGAEEEGWFRIVFSHEAGLLEEGLRRIVAALRQNHS